MLSAFGVDHGYISKSSTKVMRGLKGARMSPRADDTFQDRMKVNYKQGRDYALYMGKKEVNPNKWVKNDARMKTLHEEAGKPWKPLTQRTADVRQKSQYEAVKNARTKKEFAMRSVDAHSANARRTRKLP